MLGQEITEKTSCDDSNIRSHIFCQVYLRKDTKQTEMGKLYTFL